MGVVVGVDASIASTGFVVLGEGVEAFSRIQTAEGPNDVGSRLQRMRDSVIDAADQLSGRDVDLIAMEMPAFGKNNSGTHQLAGHWWLMAHALHKFAPVAVVAGATLKKFATGNGHAKKEEVHAAALQAFPLYVPKAFKAGNDVADASVLASMAAVHLGRDFGGEFAPSGRASVRVVRWPELRSK